MDYCEWLHIIRPKLNFIWERGNKMPLTLSVNKIFRNIFVIEINKALPIHIIARLMIAIQRISAYKY